MCRKSNSPPPNIARRPGIPAGVEFTTKPQLAQDILADMIADATIPPWIAGDEIYGRSPKLRTFLDDNGTGYVMRVGCAFTAEVHTRPGMRADAAVATHLDWAQAPAPMAGLLGDRLERRTRLRVGPVWPPPVPSIFCRSASTGSPASWPTTTATSRPGGRSP